MSIMSSPPPFSEQSLLTLALDAAIELEQALCQNHGKNASMKTLSLTLLDMLSSDEEGWVPYVVFSIEHSLTFALTETGHSFRDFAEWVQTALQQALHLQWVAENMHTRMVGRPVLENAKRFCLALHRMLLFWHTRPAYLAPSDPCKGACAIA